MHRTPPAAKTKGMPLTAQKLRLLIVVLLPRACLTSFQEHRQLMHKKTGVESGLSIAKSGGVMRREDGSGGGGSGANTPGRLWGNFEVSTSAAPPGAVYGVVDSQGDLTTPAASASILRRDVRLMDSAAISVTEAPQAANLHAMEMDSIAKSAAVQTVVMDSEATVQSLDTEKRGLHAAVQRHNNSTPSLVSVVGHEMPNVPLGMLQINATTEHVQYRSSEILSGSGAVRQESVTVAKEAERGSSTRPSAKRRFFRFFSQASLLALIAWAFWRCGSGDLFSAGDDPPLRYCKDLRRKVKRLPVATATELKSVEPSTSKIVRIEGRVVPRFANNSLTTIVPEQTLGCIVAPLSARHCVFYSASVSQNQHDGVHCMPLAYHSSCVDFSIELDVPNGEMVSVKASFCELSLFDMGSSRFWHERKFAEAPDAWSGFVIAHLIAGHDSPTTTNPSSFMNRTLEFRECALAVGATVTVVGEIVRTTNGNLELWPVGASVEADAESTPCAEKVATNYNREEEYETDANTRLAGARSLDKAPSHTMGSFYGSCAKVDAQGLGAVPCRSLVGRWLVSWERPKVHNRPSWAEPFRGRIAISDDASLIGVVDSEKTFWWSSPLRLVMSLLPQY